MHVWACICVYLLVFCLYDCMFLLFIGAYMYQNVCACICMYQLIVTVHQRLFVSCWATLSITRCRAHYKGWSQNVRGEQQIDSSILALIDGRAEWCKWLIVIIMNAAQRHSNNNLPHIPTRYSQNTYNTWAYLHFILRHLMHTLLGNTCTYMHILKWYISHTGRIHSIHTHTSAYISYLQ